MGDPARRLRASVATILLALLGSVGSGSVWAYRPFDSTDADVADPAEFELELGGARSRLDGPSRTVALDFVANLGVGRAVELVVEGSQVLATQGPAAGPRALVDPGVALKWLLRRGTLQQEAGTSVAAECGALLPEIGGDASAGGRCALIASRVFAGLALHLNVELERNRQAVWERAVGIIAEPAAGRWRPVVELRHERPAGAPATTRALAGIVGRSSSQITVDAALVKQLDCATCTKELRIGGTWVIRPH